ncbi:hypothetical protein VTK56DRAFT_2440 [Thermocarpiscus australiensis]
MNHDIRKRRAYCHEVAPAEPVFQGVPYSSPVGPDTLPLSADHRYILEQAPSTHVSIAVPLSKLLDLSRQDHQHYILEQAASSLNVPLPVLLDLSSQQHHSHKRPRLDTSFHMPTPASHDLSAQDGQEKSPLAAHLGPGVDAGRKPYNFFSNGGLSSGWTGSRLAECFASFSMCPPCSTFESQPTYQPLLTTSSYDYDIPRPPAVDTTVESVPPQSQASLVPTPITPDPTALFPCDDPAVMAQYLGGYPPLQPIRVMGVQPAPSREEMVYPSTSPLEYDNNVDNSPSAPYLGTQGQPFGTDPPVQTGAMPGAYAPSDETSTYGGHSSLVDSSSSFRLTEGYNAKPQAENLGIQRGSAVFDFFPPQRTVPAKRGPFRDQDKREKTALTRKMGSCIRCRMQRIRCNLDPENERGPCLSCKKMAITTRVYRLSCLRWKITDVRLYKPGQVKGHEWTNRWKDGAIDDIRSWESSQVRIVHVTEGYTGRSVRLQVRRFQPQEGDKLERSWVSNGVKQSISIPPYAIVNMEDTRAAFDQYIKHGLLDCCNHLLGSRDKLLWRTYFLAMKTAADSSTSESEKRLLATTLDLWMSVRLTTKSFEIVGDDTLGMPQDLIKDKDNPLHGKIPLPPVMGAQIDSVLIHQIQPQLRRKALEELQKMTQEKKQRTWLTTYLVTFILLHNIALITKHDAEYAKKHGMKRRFAREENVKEYNLGANTLLAYFHYCNKGIYPFSAECKDQDLQSLAELNDETISFVHYTRRFAAEHKTEWEDLWARDDYENEYYYVSQLFEHNWQPRTMA